MLLAARPVRRDQQLVAGISQSMWQPSRTASHVRHWFAVENARGVLGHSGKSYLIAVAPVAEHTLQWTRAHAVPTS